MRGLPKSMSPEARQTFFLYVTSHVIIVIQGSRDQSSANVSQFCYNHPKKTKFLEKRFQSL